MDPDVALSGSVVQGISMASGGCSGYSHQALPRHPHIVVHKPFCVSSLPSLQHLLAHHGGIRPAHTTWLQAGASPVSLTLGPRCVAANRGKLSCTTVSEGLSNVSHAQLHHVVVDEGTSGVLYPSGCILHAQAWQC